MDTCRNPQCVSTRAKTNQLLNDNDKARDSVVSLEKVVTSMKQHIHQLEIAKNDAIEGLAAAKAEVQL